MTRCAWTISAFQLPLFPTGQPLHEHLHCWQSSSSPETGASSKLTREAVDLSMTNTTAPAVQPSNLKRSYSDDQRKYSMTRQPPSSVVNFFPTHQRLPSVEEAFPPSRPLYQHTSPLHPNQFLDLSMQACQKMSG